MSCRTMLSVLFVAGLGGLPPAQAASYQIGFEDLPPYMDPGFPLDHYLDLGVVFAPSSGHGLDAWDNHPYGVPEGERALFVHSGGDPMYMDTLFYEPSGVERVTAHNISIQVGNLWADYYVCELNEDGQESSCTQVTDTEDSDWRLYEFSGPIYGIRVRVTDGVSDEFVMDDLRYTISTDIPTVSEWGVVVMTLLMLTTGTVALKGRGARQM